MTRLTRLKLIGFIAIAYGVVGHIVPQLTDASVIKSLTSIFVLTTLLLTLFFRQLNDVTGEDVLRSREMERYEFRRQEIRSRFWYIFILTAIAVACLWVMSVFSADYRFAWWFSALIGFFMSFAIVYGIVLIGWINEISAFSDRLRSLAQERKEHDKEIKRLAEGSKT